MDNRAQAQQNRQKKSKAEEPAQELDPEAQREADQKWFEEVTSR
jgi:hypothetical protein